MVWRGGGKEEGGGDKWGGGKGPVYGPMKGPCVHLPIWGQKKGN